MPDQPTTDLDIDLGDPPSLPPSPPFGVGEPPILNPEPPILPGWGDWLFLRPA